MKDIIIEFEIDDAKLISVNDQYMHPVRKSNNGKYYSYFAPSYELAEVQEFYQKKLTETINNDELESLRALINDNNKEVGLSLEIIIGIPPESYRRKKTFYDVDASNYIKAFEDCLARYLGIDDSLNYRVSCEKQVYHMTDPEVKYKWIVYARITPYKYKVYLNKDSTLMEETNYEESK